MNPIAVALLLAMLATLGVLIVGLIGFFRGGSFNDRYGNRLDGDANGTAGADNIIFDSTLLGTLTGFREFCLAVAVDLIRGFVDLKIIFERLNKLNVHVLLHGLHRDHVGNDQYLEYSVSDRVQVGRVYLGILIKPFQDRGILLTKLIPQRYRLFDLVGYFVDSLLFGHKI